ncbi:S-adenosyl-L-methionine-dependent methyltransferase [Russula earlei]|uniref:S-adenosyl-L-methionine-dependent methyltransferase n=1 Tax=Russula earlei TaxID=71964 RepID=A0ACC0UKJ0_9AGAM|nr:S-adenosyl-L-methionine-dependent methyltransferase [Russula earlei]
MDAEHFEPSRLGTKAHWDSVYRREVANFEETGDEGEVWFGEDSVEKMVDWALENVPASSDPRVLEIGSGNGALLFALREAGYAAPRLSGIDYSPDAVKLARSVARARRDGDEEIAFHVCDFLSERPPPLPGQQRDAPGGWDLLLDKGTYDAISLGEKDGSGGSPVAAYPSRTSSLLKERGYLLITCKAAIRSRSLSLADRRSAACNFTEEELKASFVGPETNFRFHSRVKYPSISFGGKTGSVYTTVAFKKISEQA